MRALVIQHEESAPGGLLLDWLAESGITSEVVRIDLGEPVDLAGVDILVPLGSELASYDDEVAWIPSEVSLLASAHASGVAVLGICFGGQLLARALGARTYRAASPELGWCAVGSKWPEALADGPWFQWHFDKFEVPSGAQVLAANPVAPQAYVIGRSMGLQFHPEVTLEIVADWASQSGDELASSGVDQSRLLEETAELAPLAARQARRLFDGFLSRARLGAPVGDRS